ncbi:MAG TPA: PepSY-like domain-containing protein [Bacteroidia bacterium]|jgi:hypothetical protein
MKKLFFITAAFTLFALFSFAGTDVPAMVKTKFSSLYPGVKKVKWGKEDNKYEAEFEMNEVETSVLFDMNGNVLETETEVPVSQLPSSVSGYCSKNFSGKKIKEASKIVDAKGTVKWEAEIDGKDHLFDDNGNPVQD